MTTFLVLDADQPLCRVAAFTVDEALTEARLHFGSLGLNYTVRPETVLTYECDTCGEVWEDIGKSLDPADCPICETPTYPN